MKRRLTVVEFEIYTDGDFHFDKDFLLNYTSRYFDQDFYEYTKIDDYSYSARRVFDITQDAIEFVNKIKDGCTTSIENHLYIVNDYIPGMVNDAIQNYCAHDYGYAYYDGNFTFEISICDVETEVQKIKHIEYEEN